MSIMISFVTFQDVAWYPYRSRRLICLVWLFCVDFCDASCRDCVAFIGGSLLEFLDKDAFLLEAMVDNE